MSYCEYVLFSHLVLCVFYANAIVQSQTVLKLRLGVNVNALKKV